MKKHTGEITMKMKKLIATISAIGLTFGATFATACGEDAPDLGPDIDYTITILDQDGDAVVGATFAVMQGSTQIASLTTDENGEATGKAKAGNYTVNYTALPSVDYDVNPDTAGIPIVTAFSVSQTDADIELIVSNWTKGTSLNPYVCYYGFTEVDENGDGEADYTVDNDYMTVPTVEANSNAYYGVSRAMNRKLTVQQADVTIIYGGVTYSPKDGAVEIQMLGEEMDVNYVAVMQVINATNADISLTMTLSEVVVEEEPEA
jgi:hypothetical protein